MSDRASVNVRPARPVEAARVAPLLYGVSPEAHDRFAGDGERALQLIASAFERAGNSGSAEVTRVAEVDSEPVGVMCCYPVWEAPARARAYVALGIRASPVLRRPLMHAFLHRVQRATPGPPREAMYVDALATAPAFRRRGVGRALLAAAENEARDFGLIRVALETEVTNAPARALYERCGFLAGAHGRRVRGVPRYVGYVRELSAVRSMTGATRRAP